MSSPLPRSPAHALPTEIDLSKPMSDEEQKLAAELRGKEASLYLFETQEVQARCAYSGRKRSPIPVQSDHTFRSNPITDSGGNRSVIPVHSDHC